MATAAYTPPSERDFLEIWTYVAEQRDIAAADRFTRNIREQCDALAEMPGMGRQRNDLMPGLRSFPIGDYLILYRRAVAGIEVLRVMHGARQVEYAFPDPALFDEE